MFRTAPGAHACDGDEPQLREDGVLASERASRRQSCPAFGRRSDHELSAILLMEAIARGDRLPPLVGYGASEKWGTDGRTRQALSRHAVGGHARGCWFEPGQVNVAAGASTRVGSRCDNVVASARRRRLGTCTSGWPLAVSFGCTARMCATERFAMKSVTALRYRHGCPTYALTDKERR